MLLPFLEGENSLQTFPSLAAKQKHLAKRIGQQFVFSQGCQLRHFPLSVAFQQSQAQLYIDVYQSQDSPTNTIWIFSGSSSVASAGTLRASGNFSSTADGWQTASDIYQANPPSNQTITLSPLFSSTDAIDIDSVRKRIPGGGRTNITFAVNAMNTPTITIGTTPVSRTIASMFMHNVTTTDSIGIRVSSSFNYGSYSGQASSWTGSGLLNKPIGDFQIKNVASWAGLNPNFAGSGVTMRIHSAIIPEPEEYALVFGHSQ